MSRLIRFASSSNPKSISLNKRQPLLQHPQSLISSRYTTGTLAEVAGGTAAECAAVCCCCPCGLVDLLILTMYKLPAGLCRRALKKKRLRKLIKKGLLPPSRTRKCNCGCDGTELQIHPLTTEFDQSVQTMTAAVKSGELLEKEEEAMERLEKEMWETFFGTGFWRSPSQREAPAGVRKTSGLSPRSEMVIVEIFAAASLVAKESSCEV